MAYQTGVSTTLADLISTLITFAKANGFTEGPSWSIQDTDPYYGYPVTYAIKSLVKDGVYFNFAYPQDSTTTYLWMNTASAAGGAGRLVAQQGAHPYSCRTDNLIGPYVGYHLFGDGSVVNVAVEIVTGVFVHFNFGVMQKNGDFVGGQFVTGQSLYTVSGASRQDLFNDYHFIPFDTTRVGSARSYGGVSSGHVRSQVSGPTVPLSRNDSGSTSRAFTTGWASNAGRPLLDNSPNKFNGRAVLVPINFVQASSFDSGPYYQLGTVANARVVNIANLNPKEMVNTDWMVFPVSQKRGPGTVYVNSGDYGLAYRK